MTKSTTDARSATYSPVRGGVKAIAWFCMVLLLSITTVVQAQNRELAGRVVDESGAAVAGASVRVTTVNTGTVTDSDGRFRLSVPRNARLEVSFIGYETVEVAVDAAMTFCNVVLKESNDLLEDVVVVGYGTAKKATLTGAISAIAADDLVVTKNQNAQNMLTGKVPGVRVIQKTSEPGEFNNQFDIRGFGSPLIVIDGVPRSDMERMDPNEIESITVLKDASAAIYGLRAANGVVLITTKRGERNRTKVEYNMYYGIQTPAEILKPVDAIGRMTLFNERGMRDLSNPTKKYTQEQIDAFVRGDRVSTDWYAAIMRERAPQHSHNVSVSGGGEKVDYFVSFGYMDQKGFFKTNEMDYNRYNLRSNINAQVTRDLRLSVKMSGMLDERTGYIKDSWEIFKNLWRSAPDQTIYANNQEPYYQAPESADDNPMALINTDATGFKKRGNKSFRSSVEGEYSVPWVKGLSLKAMFSYDTRISDNTTYQKSYSFYTYNEAADSYSGTARLAPSKLERVYNNAWSTLWQGSINYDNTFCRNHHLGALLLFEEAHSVGDNITASRNMTIDLPYLFAGEAADQIGTASPGGISENASQGLVGRLNYDYASKYLVEFAFRYDGSSKFPADHRWGFFPSVSAGWRISEESFVKNNASWIDNLKLRFSYGKMGDDGAADYQFVSGYDYPNTAGGSNNNYPAGYLFGGSFTNALGFRSVANPNITWYTVKTLNLGLDGDFWKGKLGFTFEIFKRDREGLLASRMVTLPGTFGSTMPQENLNSDRTKGLEIELRHHNRVGEFQYGITGQLSLTRGMRLYYETNPAGNSYDYWRNRTLNRYNDIWFGYGAAGRYTNFDQIHNSYYAGATTVPGDYIYEDWNGDGVIDDMDRHPIATTTNPGSSWQDKNNYPLMNFGFNLSASWRGIDLSMLFQGAAMAYVAYGEQLGAPLQFNGNALEMFMDRWHPADPDAYPFDPATKWVSGYWAYGATTADDNSEFKIQNGRYLRLKSLELGYTFPKKWLAKLGVKSLRVYFNAYNLWTITGVKGVDPEKPANQYGYMYPLNKTYNFGANLTF